MVNWKKFFDDENEEHNNSDIEIEHYEKTEKKKSRLDSWFEEDEPITKQKEKITNNKIDNTEESNIFLEDEEDTFEKRESFLDKIKTFFKKQQSTEWFEEDQENTDENDDEVEDYKTYFERQKNKDNNIEDAEYIKDFEEDSIFEDENFDDAEFNNQESIFSRIKNKFSSLVNTRQPEVENDITADEIDFDDDSFIDEEQIIELDKYDENNITSELETLEEIDKNEQENKSLSESLQEFGIEANNIQEVDFFKEREERRTHPTLASMKVKRIIQDKKIEDLGTDITIESDKNNLVSSLDKKEEQILEEYIEETTIRNSKNKEDIEQLNKDFNNIQRKETKQHIKDDITATHIDKALNEIKQQEENSKKDTKNYDIEISNDPTEKDRRDKLKYTSVDEILEGNNELFEDDIDKLSKKTISTTEQESPEDVETFRKEVFKQKTSEDLVDSNNKTILDDLIIETNIVEKEQEAELEEINKLNENLLIIKQENSNKQGDVLEEDISVEQVAKDSEPHYPTYDELKKEKTNEDILNEYSDYHLDLEEIEELTSQNNIDSKSENTDIDILTKEVTPNKKDIVNDIDKFTEEKTYTPPKKQEIVIEKETKNKDEKIQYVEKLYPNDVDNYFVNESSPITFGEYKTQDNGYRPVSKETIEANQRKLEAIFEKYSNSNTSSNTKTTSYIEKKISSPSPTRVGKYKPTPVYSSIYGSQTVKTSTKEKDTNKKKKSKKNSETKENKNYFKEIASQEETVWNIDLNSRVPKKQNKKDK